MIYRESKQEEKYIRSDNSDVWQGGVFKLTEKPGMDRTAMHEDLIHPCYILYVDQLT